ncbi:TIGR03960 family B12-binding radical SAM protein [bacterium]|nr:TIGR03960 family B12-binding radical SAM protein [bacterium]
MEQHELDLLLSLVEKPSRYIGHEWNITDQPHDPAGSVALVFPDYYDIGMSHLGLKFLQYQLGLNGRVLVDRFFMPGSDYCALLRTKDLLLPGLDTGKALNEFDIIGVTLQTELTYSTIPAILDLGGVSLRADQRPDRAPIVIGGGPCAFNPEPLALFFDLFVIGDGEHVFPRLVEQIIRLRAEGYNRADLLASLAEIQGVYVPSLSVPGPEHDPVRTQVIKQTIPDLDELDYPSDLIVPYLTTVHDRAVVEIARGCPNNCRFCQAQVIYRPYRERDPGKVSQISQDLLRLTGHEELSFLSLSVTDYTALETLTARLYPRCYREKVSISFPSLRPRRLSAELAQVTQAVRKTGVTLAPEAGSERLRQVINKQIKDQEIFATIAEVSRSKTRSLKLYFMIGLPTETDDDIQALIGLVLQIRKYLNKTGSRRTQMKVSISPFVPKAHTPFQWLGQAGQVELQRKCSLIKNRLKSPDIAVHYHELGLARLEAVLARGDRRLGPVIEAAYQAGAMLDGWTEHHRPEAWQQAFTAFHLDPDREASRTYRQDEPLPWDFIETGVPKTVLWQEYQRALAGKTTAVCTDRDCDKCGQCRHQLKTKPDQAEGLSAAISQLVPTIPREYRYQITFQKTGLFRFLSHKELAKTLYQALRRTEISMAYTQGFNPHPKIAFGDSLPVGYSSTWELLDLTLTNHVDPNELIRLWNKQLVPELAILDAIVIPRSFPTFEIALTSLTYCIRADRARMFKQALLETENWDRLFLMSEPEHKLLIEQTLASAKLPGTVLKKGQPMELDLRPALEHFTLTRYDQNGLEWEMGLGLTQGKRIRPLNIFQVLFPFGPNGLKLIDITKIAGVLSAN